MDIVRTMDQAPDAGPTSNPPLLIPASEVARLLGISKRTLWRLLSAGKLPAPVRLGNNVRWRLDEVEQWISQGCPSAPSDLR
jgi:prophage regulatory protein